MVTRKASVTMKLGVCEANVTLQRAIQIRGGIIENMSWRHVQERLHGVSGMHAIFAVSVVIFRHCKIVTFEMHVCECCVMVLPTRARV